MVWCDCPSQDAQQSTLLDMEMADYERLVKELNSKITEKDTQIEDLETQLQTQKKKEQNLSEEIGETASNLISDHFSLALFICQENIAI